MEYEGLLEDIDNLKIPFNLILIKYANAFQLTLLYFILIYKLPQCE